MGISIKESISFIKSNKAAYSYLLYTNYLLRGSNIKKSRKGNIAMIHSGRTGSTVLADLLSQHPGIQWDGEFFIEHSKYLNFFTANPYNFLKYKMFQHNYLYYGFEIKGLAFQTISNIIKEDTRSFVNNLNNMGFGYYIFLSRRNLLRWHISRLQYIAGGKLHTTSTITKPKKVFIDTTLKIANQQIPLIESFNLFTKNSKEIADILKDFNTLELTYEEDIFENPLIAYRKICDFLGIDNEQPVIRLKKTNPFKLEELIENYSEIHSLLSGSEFEWMLNS